MCTVEAKKKCAKPTWGSCRTHLTARKVSHNVDKKDKNAGYLLVACARSLQRAPSASEIIISPWQPVFLAPKLQYIVKKFLSKKLAELKNQRSEKVES